MLYALFDFDSVTPRLVIKVKLYSPHPTYCGPVLLAFVLGLAPIASAAAYTLNLRAEGLSNVGKYTADPDGDLEAVLSNYDLQATSEGGTRFWTFCLESQVYFQHDRTYNAAVSTSTDTASGADPISNGTAYLYQQFASGQLATLLNDGFAYDLSGGTRLQKMIWYLENETGGTQDAGMWSLLGTTFGSEALTDYSGASVKVLNLTKYESPGGDQLNSSHGLLRQDQLVYWGSPQISTNPVPDGGTTLILLASACGGLGIVRRWNQGTKKPKKA